MTVASLLADSSGSGIKPTIIYRQPFCLCATMLQGQLSRLNNGSLMFENKVGWLASWLAGWLAGWFIEAGKSGKFKVTN